MAFIWTNEIIEARDKIAGAVLKRAAENKLEVSTDTARMIASDIVALGIEAGTAASTQLRPTLRADVRTVGTRVGITLGVASIGLALAAVAAVVGLGRRS